MAYATISIPGGRNFCFKHFALRGKKLDAAVSEWRAAWLRENGETQETLDAVRQGFVCTDKEAARTRYRDGSLVFGAYGQMLSESL